MKQKSNTAKLAKKIAQAVIDIVDDCDHLHENLAMVYEDFVPDGLTDEEDQEFRDITSPLSDGDFEKFVQELVKSRLIEFDKRRNE